MPDMTVPPPNQCFADGSEGAEDPAEGIFGPPAPPSIPTNADLDGTGGSEGAGNEASDELVRRFSNVGSGGAPGISGGPEHENKSCLAEDLKALGSCGKALLDGAKNGPLAMIIAAASCAGAAVSAIDCHLENDSVSGR
jgi:hypothetical protein